MWRSRDIEEWFIENSDLMQQTLKLTSHMKTNGFKNHLYFSSQICAGKMDHFDCNGFEQ